MEYTAEARREDVKDDLVMRRDIPEILPEVIWAIYFGGKNSDTDITTAINSIPSVGDIDEIIGSINALQKTAADALKKANERYTAHEVAEILAEIFQDDCACNCNGNDEWLPKLCEFSDTVCPNPSGVACWEQYLKWRDKKGEKDAVNGHQ